MNDTPTIEEVQRITVGDIHKSSYLLSLLYDLDLLPEQLDAPSHDWKRMVILVERWSHLERQRDALRAALEKVLDSAFPHPEEQKVMFKAWTEARAAIQSLNTSPPPSPSSPA